MPVPPCKIDDKWINKYKDSRSRRNDVLFFSCRHQGHIVQQKRKICRQLLNMQESAFPAVQSWLLVSHLAGMAGLIVLSVFELALCSLCVIIKCFERAVKWLYVCVCFEQSVLMAVTLWF